MEETLRKILLVLREISKILGNQLFWCLLLAIYVVIWNFGYVGKMLLGAFIEKYSTKWALLCSDFGLEVFVARVQLAGLAILFIILTIHIMKIKKNP